LVDRDKQHLQTRRALLMTSYKVQQIYDTIRHGHDGFCENRYFSDS